MSEKNYRRTRISRPLINAEPSMVRPEFQSQVNIHNILKRGIPQQTSPFNFSDNFSIGDKIDTFEKIKAAESAFMSLDPLIRKNYQGNAKLLISDIENGNIERLKSFGVIKSDPPKSDSSKSDPPKSDSP